MPKIPTADPQRPPPPQVDPKFIAMAAAVQAQSPGSEVTKALDEAINYHRGRGEADRVQSLQQQRQDWIKRGMNR